jgi:gliding motility-associated-like protein
VPNILDNIIFDSNSGFTEEDSVVFIDVSHAHINDFIWEDVSNFDVMPTVAGNGEFTFHIWGDFILNKDMAWMYGGRLFFDSEDDEEWEQVHVDYTYPGFGPAHHLFNKTYFYGRGGKWEITYDSIYFMDTCYLWMGELLANKKHIDVQNFSAMDTLKKGLYLIDSTLVQVHQYMADGWSFNGYRMNDKTFFDAGWSTIRLLGDVSPPPGAPPGGSNMNTVGSGPDPVIYHNIEVGLPGGFTVEGEIRSFFYCKYNLVDYYVIAGNAVGAGEPSVIDTLTFKAGYDACRINDSYKINFLFAESKNDTIIGTHEIDSAYFYQRGSFLGWNWIDYLEAHQDMKMEQMNTINHAVYYGNSYNLGKNTYGKMQTFPDRIHTFSAPRPDEEHITIILDDWDVTGECDGPIRLQSDKPGFQADVYYEKINPSNDYTTRYSSIKDIRILGGKEYIAEESVDLSNNENWTWLESTDTLYYWIGGQGKWNNTQHWSRTSGGEPIDCVPKEIVHVIFDDNSFLTPSDTVYIDTTNALCKDMLWLQDSSMYKPVLVGDVDSKLFVYGSLYFGPGMQNNFLGLTYFDNINDTGPNYIHSNGTVFKNDIRMQGKGDHIILGDDIEMLVDTTVNPPIFNSIFLEHGGFETAGHTVTTAGFFSTFENERTINIEGSDVILKYEDHEGWWVYGENLDLYAENSTIYLTNFQTVMLTEKGGPDKLLQYHNVVLDSILCVVDNAACVAGYNEIYCNSMAGFISGNFRADTIYMKGSGCAMAEKSTTNVVYIDSTNCSVVGDHYINRCFVNVGKGKIEGSNHIEYCYFNAKGEFRGENVFDTLLLFAGNGVNGNGNIYIFESNKTQFVNDSLFMRGNPCANLTLKSTLPNIEGFIQKDEGYDVICDFLILQDLAVRSDNLEFYAGAFSSAIPDPNDPPSGWTMENADNYQFGFGNGKVEQFCKGETIILDAENFNAGPDAEYYWNGSDIPGDRFFTADSAGQYSLRVYYSPTCYQSDYINIETLETPEAFVDPGPYCEGEKIIAVVEPSGNNYNYDWFNGEQGSFIIAETNINSVYVTIENPINKCVTTTSQAVVVKPAPDPETFLGNNIIVKNKESFTLDAGEGDSYLWYSHPHLDIDPNDQRTITLTNYDENFGDYEFYVLVTLGGCQKEGFINGELLPPNVIGVPTAFSPNGDGVNNVLELQGVEEGVIDLDFKVYDRYGKLVFESNDWNNSWDGTYNGKKLEMDVYTYYIKARFQDGAHFEDKGNITLLR